MAPEAPLIVADPVEKVVSSEKRDLIVRQEGKSLYHSEKPDLLIQEFLLDTASEENATSKFGQQLSALRNEISAYLFEYIEGFRIPTHYVSKFSPTAMVIKRTEMIPLIVRVYNTPTGMLMKRFGMKGPATLDFPVIEHYYTIGRRLPQWINEYHAYALHLLTPEEYKQINRIASKVNAVLRGLCDRRQLFVANVQLVFGRYRGQVIVGDELSPFTCHFWDISQKDKTDQDRYLPDRESAVDTFSELYGRLMLKV